MYRIWFLPASFSILPSNSTGLYLEFLEWPDYEHAWNFWKMLRLFEPKTSGPGAEILINAPVSILGPKDKSKWKGRTLNSLFL